MPDVDLDRWDATFCRPASPTLDDIVRTTLDAGGDSADGDDAVARTTVWPGWPLDVLAGDLDLHVDETLLDVACGRGRLGVHLAASTGAFLVGVDPSLPALDQAVAHAAVRLPQRATFVRGQFYDLTVGSSSADAVLVADGFHFAVDKRRALAELARVLRPRRRLVITAAVPVDADLAGLVSGGGFDVVVLEETPDWRARMGRFADALVARREDLAAELGADAAFELAGLHARIHTITRRQRHVRLVAVRRD